MSTKKSSNRLSTISLERTKEESDLIPRFRLLAWFNVLAAVLFLGPAVIGIMLDSISRPAILSQWASSPPEKALAEIESTKDLDRLRQRTLMLQRSLDTDTEILKALSGFSDQLMIMLVVSTLVAGVGFLANAALLMWSLRKQTTPEKNAL